MQYALSCLADLLLLYSGHLDTLLGHLKKILTSVHNIMLEENTRCEQVCDKYFNPQKYQINCPKQNSDLPYTSTSWS